LVLLAAFVGLGLVSCRSGSPSPTASATAQSGEGRSVLVGSAPSCRPPATIQPGNLAANLPTGLSFPPGAGLLQVDRTAGVTTVVGESRLGIGPLQDLFRKQLVAAGHVIFSEDNEGVEAELFFATADGGVGAVRQSLARCPVGTTRFSISVSG